MRYNNVYIPVNDGWQKMDKNIVSNLRFDEKGLIPAIVQDEKGRVLMLAYMNKESFVKTIETGKMHYFSRSRKKLWLKGETSGHLQFLKEIYLDCDGDTLLFKVTQEGGTCHKGYYSCFFKKMKDGNFEIAEEKIFEPDRVYEK